MFLIFKPGTGVKSLAQERPREWHQVLISVLPFVTSAISAINVSIVMLIYDVLGRLDKLVTRPSRV